MVQPMELFWFGCVLVFFLHMHTLFVIVVLFYYYSQIAKTSRQHIAEIHWPYINEDNNFKLNIETEKANVFIYTAIEDNANRIEY